ISDSAELMRLRWHLFAGERGGLPGRASERSTYRVLMRGPHGRGVPGRLPVGALTPRAPHLGKDGIVGSLGVGMTPDKRLLHERPREAICLSLSLAHQTRAVQTRAAELRHETARYRRRQFSIVIRGASTEEVGGMNPAIIRAKVVGGILPRVAAAKAF